MAGHRIGVVRSFAVILNLFQDPSRPTRGACRTCTTLRHRRSKTDGSARRRNGSCNKFRMTN